MDGRWAAEVGQFRNFLTVPLLLVAACLAASLIPALRASAVNPVETLRRD